MKKCYNGEYKSYRNRDEILMKVKETRLTGKIRKHNSRIEV